MSNTTGVPLGELVDVSATLAWQTEVIFSNWLALNLGRLASTLGMDDLELIGTELAVGDFRSDVVAREAGTARLVVIENQFTKTDHDHLGKLLTYAAKHAAEIVVWVSPIIRDEHRAAIVVV
jgi:hypothetical protein